MSDDGASRARVRGARTVFLAYALGLAVATHWPRLKLEGGDIPRPDLLVHVLAFGGWAFLCARAAWFGPRSGARNLWWSGLLSLAYAALDEASQAIGLFHRTASWIDLAANLLGVGAGMGAVLVLGALEPERPDARSG